MSDKKQCYSMLAKEKVISRTVITPGGPGGPGGPGIPSPGSP